MTADKEKIHIRACFAIDNLELCQEFATGHENVLVARGVTVSSAKKEWFTDPNVVVVTAHRESNGHIIGGVRIHMTGEGARQLPFQVAISGVDPRINTLIEEHAVNRTAELCALWNADEVAHRGIGSYFMMRAGVALAGKLGLGSLFALCAEHTYQISVEKGFEIENSIGNEGKFNYPKLNLIAAAIVIRQLEPLPTATEREREIIFSLRQNPQQMREEIVNQYQLEVSFDLKLNAA